MVTNTKPVDFEVFLAQPENKGRSFELINGEIVEKMPTFDHAFIQALIARLFGNYFDIHLTGWALTELRIKLPNETDNDLIPDVVALLKEGRTRPMGHEHLPYMPELVVEIKSPTERLGQMWEKTAYYLAHGAKIVWLVHTEKRLVYVVTATGDQTLDENDMLDGGAVLPGFQLPVKHIFSQE